MYSEHVSREREEKSDGASEREGGGEGGSEGGRDGGREGGSEERRLFAPRQKLNILAHQHTTFPAVGQNYLSAYPKILISFFKFILFVYIYICIYIYIYIYSSYSDFPALRCRRSESRVKVY